MNFATIRNAKPVQHLLSVQGLAITMLLGVVIISANVLASGPERPTFTGANPADYVTFNSITDNPKHGDERNSVLIREAGVGTYVNDMKLQPGKEYEVYSYFHNNAKTSLNPSGKGIATNVRMSAQVPSVVKPGERGIVSTSITSDNATPNKVWDQAYVTADSAISLRYVPASAKITSNGAVNNSILSDSLFSTNGTFLGYSSLNGILPGCAEYAGYVVYKLKVDQPGFGLTKEVSAAGKNQWTENAKVTAGEKVDYRITYKNEGTTNQDDVTIKDTLPAGMKYVAGSTTLTNMTNPKGLKVSDNLVKAGINIGTYGPGKTGVVTFSATVANAADLKCGTTIIKNSASAITGNGTKTDTADVTVETKCAANECKPGVPTGDSRCDTTAVATELPTTGPAETVAGLIGIAAITIGVVYYYKSRRELLDVLHDAQSQPTITKSADKK